MRQALPVWKLFQRELEGKNPTNSRVIPGLALWNHGQGHLFGDWQWEHAQGWFSAIESGQR
jgi:hypothetical protein